MIARLISSRFVSVAISLAAIGLGAFGTARILRAAGARVPSRTEGAIIASSGEPDYVEEVAVLIGSHTCRAGAIPGLTNQTKRLIDSLRHAAVGRGHVFATVGVSMDGPIDKGEAWLEDFGDFDEITVGRNWLNSAVVQRVWDDPDPKPSIPQLLLVQHRIVKSLRTLTVGPDSLLRRWVGAGELAPAAVKAQIDAERAQNASAPSAR